jgi:hypothetical protein
MIYGRFRKLVILTICIFCACATQKKDFAVKEIQEDERAIFGRIKVKQSNLDITKNCFVVFDGASTYRLESSGLVYHRINTTSPSIVEFRCHDGSIYHFQLEQKAVIPISQDKNTANYFGDVTVNWDFKGGFKISTLFGALGVLSDLGNDGTLSYQVEDKFKETSPRFHKLHGKKANMKYVKTLIAAPSAE